MKITNFVIAFVVFALTVMLASYVKTNDVVTALDSKRNLDKALDRAIDESVNALVASDDDRGVHLDKNSALTSFYNSLFANFGVLSSTAGQAQIMLYVPVFAVADVDGFFVNYKHMTDGANAMLYQIWTEKIPYSYVHGNWTYYFTMTDDVKIIKTDTLQTWWGKRAEVLNKITSAGVTDIPEILTDAALFDSTRQLAIVERVEESLAYYTSKHNIVAASYDMNYEFNFSVGQSTTSNRKIDDVSIFVVFQGYPYSSDGDIYNRVSMSASRLKFVGEYKCTTDVVSGERLYHREYCNDALTSDLGYSSKIECAENGYAPCTKCKP